MKKFYYGKYITRICHTFLILTKVCVHAWMPPQVVTSTYNVRHDELHHIKPNWVMGGQVLFLNEFIL